MDIHKLEIDSPTWFTFVESDPNSTIYQHPAWGKLLADCYNFKSFVLVKSDENGQIESGIPFLDVNSWLTGHRWVSLPFSDRCIPLSRNNLALSLLMEYILLEYNNKGIPRVEIHGPTKVEKVFEDRSFVWHKLNLINNQEAIFEKFDRTRVRQSIRQAMERGVEVRIGNSKHDLNIFYDLMVSTRRRLGIPVQPKRFFEMLWDRLIENDLGFLLLASKGKDIIAGSIFLKYKKIITVKYNASLTRYWKLKANDLLYWTAIKWACENNYSYFDFGRTHILNQSLREFKNGWGTEENSLIYSSTDIIHASYTGRSMHILNLIIRNTPKYICRLLGALFYKHYA